MELYRKQKLLDHARMNKPGQGFYKVLAESALKSSKIVSTFKSSYHWI